MLCKGSLDARIEATETSRRAPSDNAHRKTKNVTFKKWDAPFLYPQKKPTTSSKTCQHNKYKRKNVTNLVLECSVL